MVSKPGAYALGLEHQGLFLSPAIDFEGTWLEHWIRLASIDFLHAARLGIYTKTYHSFRRNTGIHPSSSDSCVMQQFALCDGSLVGPVDSAGAESWIGHRRCFHLALAYFLLLARLLPSFFKDFERSHFGVGPKLLFLSSFSLIEPLPIRNLQPHCAHHGLPGYIISEVASDRD